MYKINEHRLKFFLYLVLASSRSGLRHIEQHVITYLFLQLGIAVSSATGISFCEC